MEKTIEYKNLKSGLVQLATEDYFSSSTDVVFETDLEVIKNKVQDYLNGLFKFDIEVRTIEFDELNSRLYGYVYIPEKKIEYTCLGFNVCSTGSVFGEF